MPIDELAEKVELMAQNAALGATRARIRKSDAVNVAAAWRDIRSHLPQTKRTEDVDGWVAMVDAYGADQGRGMFEAIAKFALWFEGFAFAKVSNA